MKFLKLFLIVVTGGALIISCSNPTEQDNSGTGQFIVQAFDAPLPGDVEAINVHIDEIDLHKSAEMSAADSEWIVLAKPDSSINFLDLVNGLKETLIDTALSTGHYTQMRLVVTDQSTVVINGETKPLKIPSGSQVGIKLNLDFTVGEQEYVTVYLDFDAAKSLKLNPGINRYIIDPTFRAYKKDVSGTIAGSVKNEKNVSLSNAAIFAVTGQDTVAGSVSDTDGNYLLVAPAGTYSLVAEAEGLVPDTTYSVDLQEKQNLTGYDFVFSTPTVPAQ